MKRINIGLVGFGTVGSGVVKVLKERHALLAKKSGVEITLRRICDLDLRRKRVVSVERRLLTSHVSDILEDESIDIVIELIGGLHPAKEIILRALKKGKHIVTANKALLAEYGEEIFKAAKASQRAIGFEASVGGGIPIIKALRESLFSNRIEKFYGIINGTSNFILTQMSEGMQLGQAIKVAQKRGVAEKNPSLDLKGIDSAHKLIVLTALAFGRWVNLRDIYVEGITDISLHDITYARELGYSIKLLAIAKKEKDELEVRVHPTFIPEEHLLSKVEDVYNAIYVFGDLIGEQVYHGEGAGRDPTASAVISDIVDIAKSLKFQKEALSPNIVFDRNIRRLRKIDEIESRYYIRFMTIDQPGVLARIAGILAQHKISIASVTQKERRKARVVPIVMMTHEAKERSLRMALEEIDRLNVVRHKSVAIRMEKL
jgi:homoserine dehydrogenase